MAKSTRGRRGIASRQCRRTPYPLPSYSEMHKNCSKIVKKDWVDATCSVCMECPHNAVLLLCSSHEKGCRPYMCATSFRYSNCLEQYKKAYTKSLESRDIIDQKSAVLACPLCRGQVKGWTIVEPAREHLNAKKRSCMQENCSFVGSFKELRKHVKAEHPSAKPREVDPTMEQKWRGLERERERDDVMSTIRSSTPGAVFFGDYVLEGNYGSDSDDEDGYDGNAQSDRNLMSVFLFLRAFGSAGDGNQDRHLRFTESDEDSDDDSGGNYGVSFAERLGRQGRVVLGRSGRRRRRGQGNGNGNVNGNGDRFVNT